MRIGYWAVGHLFVDEYSKSDGCYNIRNSLLRTLKEDNNEIYYFF